MTLMISKTQHEYPFGVQRSPGEEFEAVSQADVNLLVALGRARVKLDVDAAAESQGRADPARVASKKSSKRARSAEN